MEEDLIVINEGVFNELANKLSSELKRTISPLNVYNALFMLWGDKYEMIWILEMYDRKIDYNEAFNELVKFDFTTFENEFYSDLDLIADIVLYQKKVLIKSAGAIWNIHLNDPDHFPSSPHAHQIGENIKLDLSTGDCYRVRRFLKKIPKKELLKIREQAELKFKGKIELPPLKI